MITRFSLFIFIVALFAFSSNAQTATFTFKTVSEGGSYAPKHVLAVWIEKGDGTFVRTLFLRANARKQYLYTWNNKSGGNTTDANTGATISQHTTHTVQWNCRDLSGNFVADGDYKFVVEYTDKHAQGPKYEVPFTKNSNNDTIIPANQTYFINMNLVYNPTGVGIEDYSSNPHIFDLFPNPAGDLVNVYLNKSVLQDGRIEIMDITGRIVKSLVVSNKEMELTTKIDIKDLKKGVYILAFKSDGQVAIKKFLVQ